MLPWIKRTEYLFCCSWLWSIMMLGLLKVVPFITSVQWSYPQYTCGKKKASTGQLRKQNENGSCGPNVTCTPRSYIAGEMTAASGDASKNVNLHGTTENMMMAVFQTWQQRTAKRPRQDCCCSEQTSNPFYFKLSVIPRNALWNL